MLKPAFIIVMSLFIFKTAIAQKKDTAVYYLKASGKVVSTKDSADYYEVVLPPDAGVDKNLFIVKGFYLDGKIRFIAKSANNTMKLKFQGTLVAFFPNGTKKREVNYNDGEAVGDAIEYYPNGKLYHIKSYMPDKKVFLKQCNDSTGNILAQDGKGKWKEFNKGFSEINAEGQIVNGVGDSLWRGRINDSVGFEDVFKKGLLISAKRVYKYKTISDVYTSVDVVPQFPGGLDAFGLFLGRNIRYPVTARENNTQGRIIITFIVEKDGNLANIKIARGIGDGCDEESLRVLRLSPTWTPGLKDGKPVNVAYSVPIAFTLTR